MKRKHTSACAWFVRISAWALRSERASFFLGLAAPFLLCAMENAPSGTMDERLVALGWVLAFFFEGGGVFSFSSSSLSLLLGLPASSLSLELDASFLFFSAFFRGGVRLRRDFSPAPTSESSSPSP